MLGRQTRIQCPGHGRAVTRPRNTVDFQPTEGDGIRQNWPWGVVRKHGLGTP